MKKNSLTDKNYNYEVLEFYGNVRGKEDNWGITVSRMKWGDNPPTVNIRNTNFMSGIVGKGVSLTDVEADAVTDILLNNDFGSVEAIEEALNRRKNRLTYGELQTASNLIEGEFEEIEE